MDPQCRNGNPNCWPLSKSTFATLWDPDLKDLKRTIGNPFDLRQGAYPPSPAGPGTPIPHPAASHLLFHSFLCDPWLQRPSTVICPGIACGCLPRKPVLCDLVLLCRG